MRTQWCWRCKMDVPMLDEDEFASIWSRCNGRYDRQVLIEEYERLTGFKETVANAILHHRISMYGPPCPSCGKVLRTPIAYKCFECGFEVHLPNWSFLFAVTNTFEISGRGTVLAADLKDIEGKLSVGDLIEVWDGDHWIARTKVKGIESFHGPPPDVAKVGVLLESVIPAHRLRSGQRIQLAHSHCR